MMKKTVLLLTVLLLATPGSAFGEFEAEAVAVIDGDTFQFEAGLINVIIRGSCRMLRYNAPELTGAERPEGLRAREKLEGLIGGKALRVEAVAADGYGRWLCEVWLPDGTNVNDLMRDYLEDYIHRDIYERSLVPLEVS